MNFLKFRWLYFTISLSILIPGILALFLWGLEPSIDFTGGSLIQLRGELREETTVQSLQSVLDESVSITSLQTASDGVIVIKASEMSNEQKDALVAAAAATPGAVIVERFETIGPTLSAELLTKTVAAVALVAGIITLYVARQFNELKYGVCAISAMLHDSLILLGVFSILGHFYSVEVDVLFVTAVLTTLSFSVHDTIVVFDRIRELQRLHPKTEYLTLLNTAITQTLARSVNNSITIIIMLFALFILGGETIRWFSFALLVGAVTGTYSSTFTAVPLLTVWDSLKQIKMKKRSSL